MQELVLRDNKLTKIPDVSIFKGLLVFDVSFNEVSSLNGLSKVSNTLKELYVSKNEVTRMEEVEHLHALQILELGSNRLRVWFLLDLPPRKFWKSTFSKLVSYLWNFLYFGFFIKSTTIFFLLFLVSFYLLNMFLIIGNGEPGSLDKFTGAVAGAKSHQECEFVWS